MGQGRRLARQGIQQHGSLQLIVAVIRKLKQKGGKAEAIEVDAAAHLQHLRPVTIRQKSRNIVTWNLIILFLYLLPLFLHPIIIVLHNHEDVALREFLFPIKHHISDTLVEDICTLITASHHNGIIQSHMVIAVSKRLYQFGTRHLSDIRKARKANLRELGDVVMGYHLTNHRGIIKNARLLALAKHLIQVAFVNRQSIALQHGCIESRRFLFANRRQLRLIADKHQAVVSALIHKMYQVI